MSAGERSPEAAGPLRVAGLLGGGLAAAVLVFSLGVWVGKRATMSAVEAQAPPPFAAVPPAAPPSPSPDPVPPEQLTFYDRLSGRGAPAPVDLPSGPAPPPPGAAAVSAAAEPLAERPEAEAPARPAAPTGSEVARPSPVAAPPPARAEEPVDRLRRLAGKGGWTVQVAALSQRGSADEVVARWRGLGFEATTTAVSTQGRVLHRIRVGRFPSRETARRAAELFRSDFGLAGSVAVPR